MANTKSAKKRIRQNEKRRNHNRVYRASARTYIKRARALIEAGQFEEAEVEMRKAVSTLDKAARKGILHPRNVARRKSRLMRQFAAAQQDTVAA